MRLMRSPSKLELSITSRCNLRCIYCAHFSSPLEVPEDRSTSEWLDFFGELGRLAVLRVTMEGGEPFMRPDLPELIEGIVKNRMRFGILSNGTLITKELAAFVAGTRRCDSVQVSIDASQPEIHDSCRGKGTFFRAVQGLKNLQRHGVPVTVRATINRTNVEGLPDLARFLLDELGLPGFSTNSASHLGMCRTQADKVQLTVADRTRAMALLWELDKKYPGRITAQSGPLYEAQDWLDMRQAREEGREPNPSRGQLASCGGVFTGMAVRADGVMVPCLQLSHIELGRINQDDLGEVWRHHPELTRLRDRTRIPLSSFDFCRDCEYLPYCSGGCPALAFTRTNQEDNPVPDSCFRNFLEQGGQLPDVRT